VKFQYLIEQYGYIAVLIGTFFEGETILEIAGFLAHSGYLKLLIVVLAAFAGAMLGDQLYCYIGRWKGRNFIESRPRLSRHKARVDTLLKKHQIPLILGFRFLYGLRTVTPFVLGASRVNPGLFFILNALGALLWAVLIGVAGFYFGEVLEPLLGDIKNYERLVIMLVAGAAFLFWLGRFLVRTRRPQD